LYEFDKGEVDVDEADDEKPPHDELRLVLLLLFLTGSVLGMAGSCGGGGGSGGNLDESELHDSDELVERVGEFDMPESLAVALLFLLLLLSTASLDAAVISCDRAEERRGGGETACCCCCCFLAGERRF
jgi:hypothetical protein